MKARTIEGRCYPNRWISGNSSAAWDVLEDKKAEGATLRPEIRMQIMGAIKQYSLPLFNYGGDVCRRGCCGKFGEKEPCLYVGGAGVDVALVQLLLSGNSSFPLNSGDAVPYRLRWDRRRDFYLSLVPSSSCARDLSLLCGVAGEVWSLAVRATWQSLRGSEEAFAADTFRKSDAEALASKFVSFAALSGECATSDEWLYGRTGLLAGLQLLFMRSPTSVPEDAMETLADSIISSGMHGAKMWGTGSRGEPPLRYKWHSKEYLGAGHGYFGILCALMQVPTLRKQRDHPHHWKIRETLNWLLGQETEHGNYPAVYGEREDHLVQFCHGAPGAVYAYALAWELYGVQEYKEAAERAAICVWKYGLLCKGPGLCHGVAGNGYALLRWYQATGDATWLARAVIFATELLDRRVLEAVVDHPHSLFEGYAGTCCFLSDILGDPMNARFPCFDARPLERSKR